MKCDYPSPEVLIIPLTSQLGFCPDGSLQWPFLYETIGFFFFHKYLDLRIGRSPQPVYSIFSTDVSSSEDYSSHHLLTTVSWRNIQNADNLQCLLVEARALLSFLEACGSVSECSF